MTTDVACGGKSCHEEQFWSSDGVTNMIGVGFKIVRQGFGDREYRQH